MTMTAVSIATGMPSAVISAMRKLSRKYSENSSSTSATTPEDCTVLMRVSIGADMSANRLAATPGGRAKSSSSARTRSRTS